MKGVADSVRERVFLAIKAHDPEHDLRRNNPYHPPPHCGGWCDSRDPADGRGRQGYSIHSPWPGLVHMSVEIARETKISIGEVQDEVGRMSVEGLLHISIDPRSRLRARLRENPATLHLCIHREWAGIVNGFRTGVGHFLLFGRSLCGVEPRSPYARWQIERGRYRFGKILRCRACTRKHAEAGGEATASGE